YPSRHIYRRRNASWYRLRSELGRYLIAFEPLTFTFLANAFAVGRLATVQEFHLSRSDTNAPVRPS
uniref:Uncharacterized protein n=1 Tax=Parascaris equorum TaxID=6256 RepID=A0A914RFW4_PAREQ